MELRKLADKRGPEPPRNIPDEAGNLPDPSRPHGALLQSWPLAGVVLVGPAPTEHNFSDAFVARAMEDGYLELEGMRLAWTEGYERNPVLTGDAIVLHLQGGDLRYEVLEHPGRYDDAAEPSGKRVSHEYRCRLAQGADA